MIKPIKKGNLETKCHIKRICECPKGDFDEKAIISYAASYWPWVQTVDPDLGQNVWVPASTMIGSVYAYNDSVSEPWFAPAGINRGGLGNVIRAERKLSQTDRDILYSAKVNPIATFPGTGVVVYGQKTLQKKASALDRVNVRRLLIALKSYITQVANKLDANHPHLYTSWQKAYNSKNSYSNFDVLTNRVPTKQFIANVVPDYVTVTYSFIIQTYYMDQLNGNFSF